MRGGELCEYEKQRLAYNIALREEKRTKKNTYSVLRNDESNVVLGCYPMASRCEPLRYNSKYCQQNLSSNEDP